jgi:hypothetical protein
MAIGCHIVWHVPLIKENKMGKIDYAHFKDFPLIHLTHVSIFKILNNKVFIAHQHWKIMFLIKVFKKYINFKKIGGYIFLHHFHSSSKISFKKITYNLSFKFLFLFFIFNDGYYFGPNIFITYKIFIFC